MRTKVLRWALPLMGAGLVAALVGASVPVVQRAALESNSEKIARIMTNDLGPDNVQKKH